MPAACPDLVIGVPGANGGRGAVVVVPDLGAGLDLTKAIWLDTSDLGLQPGDALGSALTVVDGSLAAGVPGRDASGAADAGALLVWTVPRLAQQASLVAPAAYRWIVQGTDGVEGHADRQDRFGSVMSPGFVDIGGFSVPAVVVGIPNEDVGSRKNVGAVATLVLQNGQLVQNTLVWLGHGLPGKPRAGDRLGAAVVGSRAIGIPGRDANGRKDSGAVLVLDTWSASGAERTWRMFTQNTRGVPDKSERGDSFGTALAYRADPGESHSIAIGVPGEDRARRRNIGAVTLITIHRESDPPEYLSFGVLEPLVRRPLGRRDRLHPGRGPKCCQ